MSYLDYSVAETPRGIRKILYLNWPLVFLISAVASAGLTGRLDALLSVQTAGRFKPAAESYRIVTDHFGRAPAAINFVSSNGWDIYGATRFGFATVWINRAGLPVDRLPCRPGRILTDLKELR